MYLLTTSFQLDIHTIEFLFILNCRIAFKNSLELVFDKKYVNILLDFERYTLYFIWKKSVKLFAAQLLHVIK